MAQEHVGEHEVKIPDGSPTDAQRPADLEDLNLPSAFDILMKQYRDAVLRIHTLETENQKLMKQTLSGNIPSIADQAANPAQLLARIQALENQEKPATTRSGNQPSPFSAASSAETSGGPSQKIAQLRVQNTSLTAQISRLDNQLQELKSDGSHRRRRRSSRDHKHGLVRWLFRR